MDLSKFNREIPDLEGYILSDIRVSASRDEIIGFVLKDKTGKKRCIIYFGDDLRVENYCAVT